MGGFTFFRSNPDPFLDLDQVNFGTGSATLLPEGGTGAHRVNTRSHKQIFFKFGEISQKKTVSENLFSVS